MFVPKCLLTVVWRRLFIWDTLLSLWECVFHLHLWTEEGGLVLPGGLISGMCGWLIWMGFFLHLLGMLCSWDAPASLDSRALPGVVTAVMPGQEQCSYRNTLIILASTSRPLPSAGIHTSCRGSPPECPSSGAGLSDKHLKPLISDKHVETSLPQPFLSFTFHSLSSSLLAWLWMFRNTFF